MAPQPEPQISARAQAGFQLVFLVVCLAVGIGLVHEGRRALNDWAYTLEYTESSSWAAESAFGSHAEGKAVAYSGRQAAVFGVGLMAFGMMMLAWASGLGSSVLGRAGIEVPSGATRAIGLVSLAGLLVGSIALFPPWRRHTLLLYFVVLAFTLAVTLPIPDHLRKKVFPAVVGAVVLLGLVGFPVFPIFAGVFVFIIAGANLLVLWPGLKDRVEKSQKG